MQKIDFVVRWVDSNDESWRKEKYSYQLLEKGKQRNEDEIGRIRYRDYDLMKYWFRGVEKYAPWVNRVYFVTNGQKPKWLNEKCSKLQFVCHEEFIPKEWLPTFSSRTIDFNLYRIPNLSEQFVLFDDDMFLLNPTKPEDYFKNNLPCASKVYNAISARHNVSVSANVFHDMEIINKYFVKDSLLSKEGRKTLLKARYGVYLYKNIVLSLWHYYLGFQDFHLPASFLKSTFVQIWDKEYELLCETCKNKFRKSSDVNQWLLQYWQLASNCFFPRTYKFGKCVELSDDLEDVQRLLHGKKYKTICINDAEVEDFNNTKKKLQKMFENKFFEKSIFEN
jgi:hypothetical protein